MVNCALTILLILMLTTAVAAQFDVVIKNPTTSLDSSYCTSHSSVLRIKAEKKAIKEIQHDAFGKCVLVTSIVLSNNQLTKLAKNTFLNTTKLEVLQLNDNSLDSIDEELFIKLTKLRVLNLASNRLRFFPSESLKNCTYLHSLYLQSNDLLDIDERSLVGHLQNLKLLGINNNDIPCKRLEQILSWSKLHGVTKEPAAGNKRNKNYSIKKVDGIDCIDGLNGRIIESLANIKTQQNDQLFQKLYDFNNQFQLLKRQLVNITQNSKNEVKLLVSALTKSSKEEIEFLEEEIQEKFKTTMMDFSKIVMEFKTDMDAMKLMITDFKNDMVLLKESVKKIGELQRVSQTEVEDLKLVTKRRILALSNYCNSISNF